MSTATTAALAPQSLLARSRALTAGLVLLFFFSGACALVYQVLWVRLLSLSFGITVFAVTVVLSSFMSGLGLGSLYGGRLAERLRRPLVAYGLAEIGVGLVALATPAAFDALQHVYPSISRGIGENEAGLFFIRVVLSLAVLVVPTFLMGATLPIVMKSSLMRTGELSGKIGLLYTANTFGAIAGALTAGFWMIGEIGISRSIQTGAAINCLIGLGAILLQRLVVADDGNLVNAAAARGLAYSDRVRRLTLIAYGLSGVCSFAYEVAWTRMLALVLDTSIYAFATMLSMVLVGIAVGSAVVTPLLRRRWNWPLIFAGLEVLIALGALWAVWAVAHLSGVKALLEANPRLSPLVVSSTSFNFVVASLSILPSTLVIGVTFPIAARIYTAGLDRPSERVGQIYSANVFGAIVGSMLGGFVLLPSFGTQTSLLLISLLSLVVAAFLALGAERPPLPARASFAVLGVTIFTALWLVKPDLYQALFRARFPGAEVTWYREGLETTVSIVKDGRGIHTLFTNSRGQSNDDPSLVNYHRQIAHLPLLVKPAARDVLIVGLGSGNTAGSILQHDGTRVEVIELSDAILAGANQFRHINFGVLDNPNFSLKLGDGRNYLLTTQKRYDLVTNDTIQPFDAGATNLYSAEYYRLALSVLRPNGIVAQWLGPIDDFQYRMMMRTFISVFPYSTLWLGADLIIGSPSPIKLDLVETGKRFASPTARQAMSEIGYTGPEAAQLWFVADKAEMEAYVGPGPLLTDDRPLIEYYRSMPGRGRSGQPDLSRFSRDASKVLVQH